MNLTKSQVKQILDMLKINEHISAIYQAWWTKIDDQSYFVATDSYTMVLLKTDTYNNGVVSFDDLNRWYKLADGKSRLNDVEAVDLATDKKIEPPKIEQLIKVDSAPIDELGFNATYALRLEKIAGESLRYTLTGKTNPMIAETTTGKFILMPLR